MPLRRRPASRSSFQRTQRRKTIWADLRTDHLTVASVPSLLLPLATLESAMGAQTVGSTVVRMHGHVTPRILGVGTLDWTVGIGVFPTTSDADDLDPMLNPFLDWMIINHEQLDATATGRHYHSPYRFEFDLKSKRKLDEVDDQLFLVIKSLGAGLNFFISCRTLLLLP